MQNLYKLQQGKTKKVRVYVTQLEGALNALQQEYSMMLSISEVHKYSFMSFDRGPTQGRSPSEIGSVRGEE